MPSTHTKKHNEMIQGRKSAGSIEWWNVGRKRDEFQRTKIASWLHYSHKGWINSATSYADHNVCLVKLKVAARLHFAAA